MNRLWVIPILFLLLFSFGCIGGDQSTTTVENDASDQQQKEPVTAEQKLTEIPKIVFSSVPDEVRSNEDAYFQWTISGATGTISSTELYYGTESNPNVDEYTSPTETVYEYSVSDTSGNFQVPGTFESLADINEPGTYYARAHVYINGKHYWTDEVEFTVVNPDGRVVREVDMTVSDDGFDPSVITVDKDDHVILRVNVASNTNSAGIRIVSPYIQDSSNRLMPGDTYVIEFDAEKSFDIRMFWIAGNIPKASAHVEVENN